MLDKLIKRLERGGKIRKQKAGFVQIESLLKEAMLDLDEAKKITHLAERATYLLAYNAMLKAGRALMLLRGYVPDDGAQHKTVVKITSAMLGEKYSNLTDQFESMRRKRNEMTYESGTLLSKSEAQKVFSDAMSLVKKIFTEAKAHKSPTRVEIPAEREIGEDHVTCVVHGEEENGWLNQSLFSKRMGFFVYFGRSLDIW